MVVYAGPGRRLEARQLVQAPSPSSDYGFLDPLNSCSDARRALRDPRAFFRSNGRAGLRRVSRLPLEAHASLVRRDDRQVRRYPLASPRSQLMSTICSGDKIWGKLSSSSAIVMSHPDGWADSQQAVLESALARAGSVLCLLEGAWLTSTFRARRIITQNDASTRLHFLREAEASIHWCLHVSDTQRLKVRLLLRGLRAELTLLPFRRSTLHLCYRDLPVAHQLIPCAAPRSPWLTQEDRHVPPSLSSALANLPLQTIDTALYVVEATAPRLTLRDAKASDCIQGVLTAAQVEERPIRRFAAGNVYWTPAGTVRLPARFTQVPSWLGFPEPHGEEARRFQVRQEPFHRGSHGRLRVEDEARFSSAPNRGSSSSSALR
mgnify:FL=1